MDATTSDAPAFQYITIPDQPITAVAPAPLPTFQRQTRHCFGNSTPGEFPLAASPSIVLHVLTSCDLDAWDLAKLEATCSFFRQPAKFFPDFDLSITELAALDMCQKRALFKSMSEEARQEMKCRCGGSWKLVFRFLLSGEASCRRGKSHAIAGPGHSLVVTSQGMVYSFGCNTFGQLGRETASDDWRPQPIRSLTGIRIIQAVAGAEKTMLVSDMGQVYAFGKISFRESEIGVNLDGRQPLTTPKLIDSLKDIFVVQAVIGNFFTAVLSREGRVYTMSWGKDARVGHQTDPDDTVPYPLLGALDNVPVVQIAAGYCYLLALACQPGGMAVYSVGCGLGGKLGHGSRSDEKYPRLIEQFKLLKLEPVVVAAGSWHAAVIGRDGQVCTWGWGRYGCLGHGDEECEPVPKVVSALSHTKAVHIATGDYTTFVVSEDGDVYSFGSGESALGHGIPDELGNDHQNILSPKLIPSLKQVDDRVVHVSTTNSIYWTAHTFALTESGKLYALGAGDRGQLGTDLQANPPERDKAEQIDIDLS